MTGWCRTCTKETTQSTSYMQIVGIIFGMMTMGYLGDKIGREWSSLEAVNNSSFKYGLRIIV